MDRYGKNKDALRIVNVKRSATGFKRKTKLDRPQPNEKLI